LEKAVVTTRENIKDAWNNTRHALDTLTGRETWAEAKRRLDMLRDAAFAAMNNLRDAYLNDMNSPEGRANIRMELAKNIRNDTMLMAELNKAKLAAQKAQDDFSNAADKATAPKTGGGTLLIGGGIAAAAAALFALK
jgi:hypothetical protein